MLRARQVGLHRMSAGGDQDGLGRDLTPVRCQNDRVSVGQRRAGVEHLGAGALNVAAVDVLEALDLPVLVGQQGRPVEARAPGGPAEALGILELVAEAAGVDEQLLGDAAADHAGSAEPVFLGDAHPGAVARRDAPRAHAARSTADDEEVKVVVAHGPVPCTYMLDRFVTPGSFRRP